MAHRDVIARKVPSRQAPTPSCTLARAEHVIATRAVRILPNRQLGEYFPSWAPGEEDHSPNTLFSPRR